MMGDDDTSLAYHTTGRTVAVGPRAGHPSGGARGVVEVVVEEGTEEEDRRGPVWASKTPVGARLP